MNPDGLKIRSRVSLQGGLLIAGGIPIVGVFAVALYSAIRDVEVFHGRHLALLFASLPALAGLYLALYSLSYTVWLTQDKVVFTRPSDCYRVLVVADLFMFALIALLARIGATPDSLLLTSYIGLVLAAVHGLALVQYVITHRWCVRLSDVDQVCLVIFPNAYEVILTSKDSGTIVFVGNPLSARWIAGEVKLWNGLATANGHAARIEYRAEPFTKPACIQMGGSTRYTVAHSVPW